MPDDSRSFHAVYKDPEMSSERFCAGCHQFNFVKDSDPFIQFEKSPAMQNTIQEHRGTFAHAGGMTCRSCHFKNGDHSLHGTAADDMRKQIQVAFELKRSRPTEGPFRLKARVRITNLGHAFPTGDLFRVFSLYAYDARGRELLKYDFRKEMRVVDRFLIKDTTLKPKPGKLHAGRELTFALRDRPTRCLAVYRLQGGVEPELMHELPLSILRRKYYDGPCDSNGFRTWKGD